MFLILICTFQYKKEEKEEHKSQYDTWGNVMIIRLVAVICKITGDC